ncbi:MAG: SulP family inorganic anion transporter, partial [Actinomycetes bacterium]
MSIAADRKRLADKGRRLAGGSRPAGPGGTRPRGAGRLGIVARDSIAGVSVAFVLVPQSLAYAQLAGLPPERGLYAAALAPIVAAFAASSPYLQTGPTAITSLLVLGVLSTLAPIGGPEYIALAALLAVLVGVWRLLLGLIGGGSLAYLMSQPVLLGFTAAATVLIIASQLPAVLGAVSSAGNPLASGWDVVREPGSWHPGAVAFALAAALVILLSKRVSALLPGVLIAVVGAIAVSVVTGYAGPTVGRLPTALPVPSLDLPWAQLPALLVPALVIALIGFAEPAAIARQYAAADRHNWDPNREMLSQGLANVAAGLGGGYAVGGSFSRTALNRLAGARTRASGALTGVVVLALLPVAGLLARLPVAVLGAAVITAVLPLLAVGTARELWTYSRPQAIIAAATFVLSVVLAPRIDHAVLIGIGLAVAVHLWRELHVQVPSWTEGEVLHLRPSGVLYFASTPPIEEMLTHSLVAHPDATGLVLHCDGLGRIDLTGALALRAVLKDAQAAGLSVELADVAPQAMRIVSRVLPDL